MVSLSALDIFHSARTLRSSVYGSSDPDREVPELAPRVLDGALDLGPLITDRTGLDDAPAAFDRMARGEGARWVVTLDQPRLLGAGARRTRRDPAQLIRHTWRYWAVSVQRQDRSGRPRRRHRAGRARRPSDT